MEINAAIQSTKALSDLLKATRELRNANEFAAAINEISTKLIQMIGLAAEAREKQLALTDEIRELKKENVELKDWKREAERYQMTEIAGGVIAYRLKPGMEQGEEVHSFCATCFDDHKKSPLQSGPRVGGLVTLRCTRCNAVLFPGANKRPPKLPDPQEPLRDPNDPRFPY